MKKEVSNFMKKLFGGRDPMQVLLEHKLERFSRSWSEQVIEERKWRMSYVEKMVLEKNRIFEKHGHGCLMWCDMAIENIITGDRDGLRICCNMFLFECEDPEYAATMMDRFRHFSEICREAYDTMVAERTGKTQA